MRKKEFRGQEFLSDYHCRLPMRHSLRRPPLHKKELRGCALCGHCQTAVNPLCAIGGCRTAVRLSDLGLTAPDRLAWQTLGCHTVRYVLSGCQKAVRLSGAVRRCLGSLSSCQRAQAAYAPQIYMYGLTSSSWRSSHACTRWSAQPGAATPRTLCGPRLK